MSGPEDSPLWIYLVSAPCFGLVLGYGLLKPRPRREADVMLIKLAAYGVVMSATAAFISADLIPIGAAVALTAAILFGLLVAAIRHSSRHPPAS